MHIKKGDQVTLIRGKDRGKSGAVLKVLTKENRIIVEGLNMFKKRVRPRQQGKKGETVPVNRPLDASNVMLVCRGCKEKTRVGYRYEGNEKVRYCKNCKAVT